MYAERVRAERLLNALRLGIVLVLGMAALIYAPSLPVSLRYANAAVLIPMMYFVILGARPMTGSARDAAVTACLMAVDKPAADQSADRRQIAKGGVPIRRYVVARSDFDRRGGEADEGGQVDRYSGIVGHPE